MLCMMSFVANFAALQGTRGVNFYIANIQIPIIQIHDFRPLYNTLDASCSNSIARNFL